MNWISVEDQVPKHMQEVKVQLRHPALGIVKPQGNAVFLAFDQSFCFSDTQQRIDYVTHWRETEATQTKDER